MFNWFLLFLILKCLFFYTELFLNIKQIVKIEEDIQLAQEFKQDFTKQEIQNADEYNLDKLKLIVIKKSIMLPVQLFMVYNIARIWDMIGFKISRNDYIQGGLFVAFFSFINFTLEIPFAIYDIFILDEYYGFNNRTYLVFFKELMKGVTFPFLLGLTVWLIILDKHIVKKFIWVCSSVVSLILGAIIVPEFILPYFLKDEQLPEGPLRTAVNKVVSKFDFPIENVFIMEESSKSNRINAYIKGIWNSRVYIYDTLLKQKEVIILSLLLHELGHWEFKHYLMNMSIFFLVAIFLLALFTIMYKHTHICTSFGFSSRKLIIGFYIYYLFMLELKPIFSLAFYALSRHLEYQADRFAVEHGNKADMVDTLLFFAKSLKSNLKVDTLYEIYYFSHPAPLKRIATMREL